jgi:transposase
MFERKLDVETFTELWNAGVSGRDIADFFNVSLRTVYTWRYMLGLPKRQPKSEIRKLKAEQKVATYLLANNGYASKQDLEKVVCHATICRLWREAKLIRVEMHLHKNTGGYKRNVVNKVFKEGFHGKAFYCLNRTALVRLMQNALKKPEDNNIRRVLRAFLRLYLTEAEQIAVLWKLGVREWKYRTDLVKQSIQIDGIVKPKNWGKKRRLLEACC